MVVSEVRRLSVEGRFRYWVQERHQIYLRRRAGKPRPWTDDEILRAYRFCNPVRKNDKVSRWLLDHWYGPNRGHTNTVLAAVLARQVNNPETLAEIGFPDNWGPERVRRVIEDRQARGLVAYSAAYMITSSYGGRGRQAQTKAYQTAYTVCDPVHKDPPAVDPSSLERTWRSLLGRPGLGSFVAGQVAADLRWAMDGSWQDKDSWAPLGPGSARGLNRLLGRRLTSPVGQDEFLRELPRVAALLAGPMAPTLEAMDVQACLCELDKYERVLWGEGRPRQNYDGVGPCA